MQLLYDFINKLLTRYIVWTPNNYNKGHPQAQTNLGYMYLHGYGVEKSVSEAIRYFKLAADQGNAEGQLNLGTLYYSNNELFLTSHIGSG